jgi:TatD DNase family protein
MYVDAHNHLQDARLTTSRSEIASQCEKMGVSLSVVNGTSPKDWADVSDLAARHSWILPSYGVHPWFLSELTPSWRGDLERYLDQAPSALGEIGIDYWKEGIDRELQRTVFLEQLSLARDRNIPVSIHGLKAWHDLYALLERYGAPEVGFLLHSYSGPLELIKKFVRMGAYFSCAPAFFAPSRAAKLEVFRTIPLERLLPETDAPDQAPPRDLQRSTCPEDERLNHPANISMVYDGLARLTGMPEEKLSAVFMDNARRLFGSVMRAPLQA